MKRMILLFFVVAFSTFCFFGCKKDKSNVDEPIIKVDNVSFSETEDETNYVKIEMETGDAMLIELYPNEAPITVENFKKLVSEDYYDGLTFHRVVKDFVIQGGNGKKTDTIKGEFYANGVNNQLKHERGVVSMARTILSNNSASSQFFICLSTERCSQLDGQYATFGRVIAGMDTVDKIANVETSYSEQPLVNQVMKKVSFVKINNTDSK